MMTEHAEVSNKLDCSKCCLELFDICQKSVKENVDHQRSCQTMFVKCFDECVKRFPTDSKNTSVDPKNGVNKFGQKIDTGSFAELIFFL